MDAAEIYTRYKNAVYRLAMTYLHSPAEAEDVTQDVFLKWLAHREKVRPGKERAWLLTVTANLCRDRLRFWKRHAETPLPEEIASDGDASDLLAEVMALPVKERTVVHLYYYEGFSTAEIARIQRITQTAVTTRLARARRRLKERLEDHL